MDAASKERAAVPPEIVTDRVATYLQTRPAAWRPVRGGYTSMERWSVAFEDGTSAFVKIATADTHAEWLRAEHRMYNHLRAPFMARMLGWEDGPRPMLLLEDLGAAHWPP